MLMTESVLIVPYVLAYFVRDNKVLLSLRKSSAQFGANQYALIGGKIASNESPTEALKREVKEEVGCDVDGTIKNTLYFKGASTTCVAFTFSIDSFHGEPVNLEHEKHESITWVALTELPETLLLRHRYIIECIQKGKVYAEWGFE